jgi:hypothetical protein
MSLPRVYDLVVSTKAEAIVQAHLRKLETPSTPFSLNDAATIERPFGWVFLYNSQKFLETRDPMFQLAGNGPIIVNRHNGVLTVGPSNKPVAVFIEEYEHGFE